MSATTYPTRIETLPAFDVAGHTAVVASGGEQYGAVRGDGRWERLRDACGGGQTIHGVASMDGECPRGRYRYTVGLRVPPEGPGALAELGDLHPVHVRESEWVVFTLADFGAQYGEFWQADPYALVRDLGWEFNPAVGLHIDVYAPTFVSDHDAMEFWMPVRKPRG